ncbi:MAG: 30S ribosomal protein S7 [Planctomycetes bacterium]|nr:30S ribosomal protein S7 [Planctomycetota bacterium]
MGRKRFTKSAEQLKPDVRYGSKLVSKFINNMMWDGKKSVAQAVFYDAMDIIAKRVKDTPPNEVFEAAVDRVKPNVEVRSRRVGGSNYQVPMQVNRKRQLSLAIRWILQAARSKSGKPMCERLAAELLDASRGDGAAVTIKQNIHRMADANKAFAHFAW